MASSPTSIKSDDGQTPIPRGYSKRGDGFSVQETEGLLTEIRERWQEGWDVIAEVHNTQFPGHKRTAGSLKRKFAKLYRTKIEVTTKEKHARAAIMAKKVREEMRVQRRGLAPAARGLADDLIGDTDTAVGVQGVHEDLSEVEIIGSQPATQPQSLTEAPVTPNEQDLRQTLAPGVPLTQGTPDAWQAAMNRWPIAGESLRRLRSRAASGETVDTQDLAQTMLMVLLDSQHQRDVERDQERGERRLEKQQWQEEMREQQRRHEQERIEDRRRNEQFMQVMTTLVAQIAAGQQRGGLN